MTHSRTTALDALVDGARHRLDALRETHERLDRIRFRVTSPDNLVTVVADGSGAMVELEIAGSIRSVGEQPLATSAS